MTAPIAGPYEHTGAYRPDALAQMENTEPQWSDAPVEYHLAVGKTELGYTRQICKTCGTDWPCPEMVAFREEQLEAEVAAHERGGLGLGIAFIITLIGLFLLGLLNAGHHPDMRIVGAAAIVGTAVLSLGTFMASYRRHERDGAARTEKIEGRVQQSTSTEHFLDGA